MSLPREGSRETGEGLIVSEAMDWCRSPTAPVPYRIWARQIQATDLANSVRQTDERSHVKGSVVLASYGDEPGVGGGVASGTHNAECTPKTWSATVFAEGRNMVRHDDEWWMNHRNTYGRLSYVKDRAEYPTPNAEPIQIAMADVGGTSGASVDAGSGVQQAQWFRLMPRLAPGGGLDEGPIIPRMGPKLEPRIPPRLAPKPGPEPGPEPQPGPQPPAPRPAGDGVSIGADLLRQGWL